MLAESLRTSWVKDWFSVARCWGRVLGENLLTNRAQDDIAAWAATWPKLTQSSNWQGWNSPLCGISALDFNAVVLWNLLDFVFWRWFLILANDVSNKSRISKHLGPIHYIPSVAVLQIFYKTAASVIASAKSATDATVCKHTKMPIWWRTSQAGEVRKTQGNFSESSSHFSYNHSGAAELCNFWKALAHVQ